MKAWVIDKISDLAIEKKPLKLIETEIPVPEDDEILIKVYACGVCHTEIDEIEGRLKPSFFPLIPGHQITGEIVERGKKAKKFNIGDRVGAGWIYFSCGKCEYCRKKLENLCPYFLGTGKDVHGGYAEYFKIKENFAFPIPKNFDFVEAAPLFCAGAIGYRSLMLTKIKDKSSIGLIGFGASAHIVLKTIKHTYPESSVFVFARDENQRKFALNLGAIWAGDIDDEPPSKLDAAIDTTPVWSPPFKTLKHLKPGARLVINAIRKEETDKATLLAIDYQRDFWLEREIKSVANVTRKDIKDFLKIAEEIPIKPEVEIYSFEEANNAILDIKNRKIKGAKVLKIGE